MGIVLTVLLLLGSVITFPFGGGIGERTERPTTVAQTVERFELGIGQLTIDLTDLPLQASGADPVLVRARLGIGELVVVVPGDAVVRVEARAGLGDVQVFDLEDGGFDVEVVTEPPGTSPALDLRLSVGLGEVSVERG
jgi:predicted membrane protein